MQEKSSPSTKTARSGSASGLDSGEAGDRRVYVSVGRERRRSRDGVGAHSVVLDMVEGEIEREPTSVPPGGPGQPFMALANLAYAWGG